MTYFAIDKNNIGTYIEADDWTDAENFCLCDGLDLIGEVKVIIEAPGMN